MNGSTSNLMRLPSLLILMFRKKRYLVFSLREPQTKFRLEANLIFRGPRGGFGELYGGAQQSYRLIYQRSNLIWLDRLS